MINHFKQNQKFSKGKIEAEERFRSATLQGRPKMYEQNSALSYNVLESDPPIGGGTKPRWASSSRWTPRDDDMVSTTGWHPQTCLRAIKRDKYAFHRVIDK